MTVFLGSLDSASGDETYFSEKKEGMISPSPALQARKSFLLAVQRVPEQLVGESKLGICNPGIYGGRMVQSYGLLGKTPFPVGS